MKLLLFLRDYHTICKLTFLLRRVGYCQLNKTVIISTGLPHILKTESSLMRLLFLPSSWSCGCFPRTATYFASLLFNCRKVATHVQVESLLGRLGCCRSDKASNYSCRATINSASWLFIGSPLYFALVVRSWCSPGFYVAPVCAWSMCMADMYGSEKLVCGSKWLFGPLCVLGRPWFQDVVSSRHRAG